MRRGKAAICRVLCVLLLASLLSPAADALEAESQQSAELCTLTEGCTLPSGHEGDCEAEARSWAEGDVFADSESGLAYRITDEAEKEAEVAYPCEETARRRYELPETVINAESGEEYAVVGIGEGAFKDCAVKEISASKLRYIGEYAFSGSALTELGGFEELASIGAHAFEGSALVSAEISEGAELIAEYAFAQCSELKYISISESVSYIGEYAFSEISPGAVAVFRSGEPPEAEASVFESSTLLLCREGSRSAYEDESCALAAYFAGEGHGYALELADIAVSVGSSAAADTSGIVLPEGAELKWASGDESVARVSGGAITAKSAGKATIYVSIIENGFAVETAGFCFTVNPAAHTHSWSESWEADWSGHWHTCLADGCTETADFAGHDFGEWKLKREATESETGLMERKCKFCGYKESIELPEHTHSAVRVSAVPATCTESGCKAYYVCECGKLFADSECKTEITDLSELATEPLGHSDADRDGVCDTCFTRISSARRKHG